MEQQWSRRSQVLECVIVHAVQHASPIAEKDIWLTCAADRNFFLSINPEKQDNRNGLRSTGDPQTGWAIISVGIFWPNHFIHHFFFSGFVLLFSFSGYCEYPWNGQQHSWRLSSACGLSSSGGQHIIQVNYPFHSSVYILSALIQSNIAFDYKFKRGNGSIHVANTSSR